LHARCSTAASRSTVHARRHHGWDQPGVPVTGVLLLMCALFLAWLALQHPAAPAAPPNAPVLI